MRAIDKITDVMVIRVTGKNMERFVTRLIKNGIEIMDMKKIHYNEIDIRISTGDYSRVLKLQSIYKIRVLRVYGKNRLKNIVQTNRLLLMSIGVGILVLLALSNIIFSVQVIHGKREVRELVLSELYENGLWKYRLKKSYQELEEIEDRILKAHKDDLEWLEIENVGTSYVVRVEERMKLEEQTVKENRHIVAKKNAIVSGVTAKRGQIVRNVHDYVRKGDIIVSGEIVKDPSLGEVKDEEEKVQVAAEGTVYGEVWYTVNVNFPLNYNERVRTGRKKTVYGVKIGSSFLGIELKGYHKKDVNEEVYFKNALVPIKFVSQKQWEVKQKDRIYTTDEAVIAAEELAVKKIKSQLSDKERILNQKKLKVSQKDSTITVRMFFSVYEDITDYMVIPKEQKTEEEKQP